MLRLALATCQELPDLDEDGPPLRDALGRVGVDAVPAVWSDPSVDWAAYDGVLVRSTWDYTTQRDAFVAWADRVAACTRLANPASVIRWNTDKRYLRELADHVPVVATEWLEPGDDVALPADGEHVVKPAVSAGARDTLRYTGARHAEAHALAARLLATGRTVMVQPYLEAVDEVGETALVYFGGRFSHALRKGPLLTPDGGLPDGLYAEEEMQPRDPSDAERALAEAVLDAVPFGRDALLYARVDLVPGADGAPVLLELELTEPSFFFAHAPGAADRLAAAVVAWVVGSPSR